MTEKTDQTEHTTEDRVLNLEKQYTKTLKALNVYIKAQKEIILSLTTELNSCITRVQHLEQAIKPKRVK